jgi:Anti-sigma-K factor rskA, C-terminal
VSTDWRGGHAGDGGNGRDAQTVADSHEFWDALAVGFGLSALEPDELDRFVEHLVSSCPQCRKAVDDTASVGAELAAALGSHVPPVSENLRDDVLHAALLARPAVPQNAAGLTRDDSDGPVSTGGARSLGPVPPAMPAADELAERRRRRTSTPARLGWLAAAAAAIVAIVLSVATVSEKNGRTREQARADRSVAIIDALTRGGSATVVPLHTEAGATVATVLAHADSVSVVAQQMPPNPASTSYVLWGKQTTGTAPVALGVFDVRSDGVQAVQVAADSRGKYKGFTTFAISQEPGHTPPPAPSKVMAIGNV